MGLPRLETIFELEDEIRRSEQQLKVQRWTRSQLLKAVEKDPRARWHKLAFARIWYRFTKLVDRVRKWLRKGQRHDR